MSGATQALDEIPAAFDGSASVPACPAPVVDLEPPLADHDQEDSRREADSPSSPPRDTAIEEPVAGDSRREFQVRSIPTALLDLDPGQVRGGIDSGADEIEQLRG